MCVSLKGIIIFGLILAALDLLHGIATLSFYAHQFYTHFHCRWKQGIRLCEFFIYETNHNIRVNIGLAEGIISILFACLLVYTFIKHRGWLVWVWLIKALSIVILNAYFVIDWIVKRGSNHIYYYEPEESDQELLYIYVGAALTVVELIYSFLFCCVAVVFSYQVKRQLSSSHETNL